MPSYTINNWRQAESDLHGAKNVNQLDVVWNSVVFVGFAGEALEKLTREYKKKLIQFELIAGAAAQILFFSLVNQTDLALAGLTGSGNGFFNFDTNGDVEVIGVGSDPNFELDANSDIQPK